MGEVLHVHEWHLLSFVSVCQSEQGGKSSHLQVIVCIVVKLVKLVN